MKFFKKYKSFVKKATTVHNTKQKVEITSFSQLVHLSQDLKKIFINEITKLEATQEQLLYNEDYEALAKIEKLKKQYRSVYENQPMRESKKI